MSVYFIQAKDGGPIKIGYASDARARLRQLQTSHHRRLVLRRVIKSGTPENERELHARFAAHRLVGEWFRADPEVAVYGKCKADKTERQKRDEIEAARWCGQTDTADALIRVLKSDGPLSLPELLRLARMINSDGYSSLPEIREPVLRLLIAFLYRYGGMDDPRIEECERELRYMERKRT
jgi:hypothetical protein